MEKNVLEKLQEESESLYNKVLKTVKKKWDVTDFQKLSPKLYIVKVANTKKPDKTLQYKCFYIQGAWTIWAYEDESKLKESISALKK